MEMKTHQQKVFPLEGFKKCSVSPICKKKINKAVVGKWL